MGKRKFKKAWPMAVLTMVSGLIMVTAAPASAASGSGVGTGVAVVSGQGIQQTPPCARIDTFDLVKEDVGTWEVGGRTYVGPATVTIDVALHYADPNGTHLMPNCSDAPGQPIVMNASVATPGNPPVPGIDCSLANGTYERLGVDVEFQWTTNCTVTDATGTTSSGAATINQTGVLVCPFFTQVPATYACPYAGQYTLTTPL